MFQLNFVKALKNNAFKAVFTGFTATTLSLGLTACGPIEQVKSVLAEDVIPPMPAPEVANTSWTYRGPLIQPLSWRLWDQVSLISSPYALLVTLSPRLQKLLGV